MPLGGDEREHWYPESIKFFDLILQGDLFNECWKDKKVCDDLSILSDRLSHRNYHVSDTFGDPEGYVYPPQLPLILLVGTSFKLFGNTDSHGAFADLSAAK